MPYIKLDPLELRVLNSVVPRLGVKGLSDPVKQELNLAWHRLDGWPDVKLGLEHLARRYRMAACSNGNISLMADLASRNGWRCDAILGADNLLERLLRALFLKNSDRGLALNKVGHITVGLCEPDPSNSLDGIHAIGRVLFGLMSLGQIAPLSLYRVH